MNAQEMVIYTCVGGGPMERLAAAFEAEGMSGRVCSDLSDDAWRALMATGRFGRLAARLRSMVVFPIKAIVAAAKSSPGAVAVPTTNPFYLPLILVLTRRLHGRSVVPLVYDLYPDALEAGGLTVRGGMVSKLAQRANTYWFARADALVFIGERMAEHAIDRYGPPRRYEIIETGADPSEFTRDVVRTPQTDGDLELWCEDKIVASYVGNMGAMHDWETLADALPRALSVPEAHRLAVVIAASGPGVEQLKERWRHLPPDRVRFVQPLPNLPWARLLARSEIALVTLRHEAARTSIPSKAFSAMAAGSAVVAIAPRISDLWSVIEANRCGVNVEPGNVDGLVRALVRLATDDHHRTLLRQGALTAAVERYDIRVLARRWQALLSMV